MPVPPAPRGIHLRRSDENTHGVTALAEAVGGACGLEGLLDDLRWRARRMPLPRLLGRQVREAYSWDWYDVRDRRWWPQGISTSADATDEEVVGGRRVLVTTWYSKEVDGVAHGSRVTFLDLDSLRYRHVLLVEPRVAADGSLVLEPLHVHAGGIVWVGPYLHVAATSRGLVTARVDDIMRVPASDRATEREDALGVHEGQVSSFGHRYVLPVLSRYRAFAEEGHESLRYSFLSLDRRSDPPAVVAGEYARRGQTTRLARYPLDPATGLLPTGDDGLSWPLELDERGVRRMQGAVVADGRWHVTVSNGPWRRGTVYSGRPGELRAHPKALPIGPEDIAYWPSTDRLWSVTEHPWRRWVVAMDRSAFD